MDALSESVERGFDALYALWVCACGHFRKEEFALPYKVVAFVIPAGDYFLSVGLS